MFMKKLLSTLSFSIALLCLASCSTNRHASQATNNVQSEANTNATWNKLQREPLKNLTSITIDPTDSQTAGWTKLAIINKTYNNNAQQLSQALAKWRKEYPKHPGNKLFPEDSTLTKLADTNKPKHIAVLLPLQGEYAAMGNNIRVGIMSAYNDDANKALISFYDTDQNPKIAELYQKAIKEGADFIIGPLTKSHVQAMQQIGNFSMPVLALNYTGPGLPANFYEFGLSPQDEAAQLIDKAHQSGFSHAIIIAPQSAWGHHVADSLSQQWQSVGAQIVDTYYFSATANFNQEVARLMHANPDTKASNQYRQDVDVVFLLAKPESARQIVPAIKQYANANIPIYSTSIIYSGQPSEKDVSLNGVAFMDAPLTLQNGGNRMYALGRDAYYISQHLPRMVKLANFPVNAATGALTLSSNQQIHRRLPWVIIHDGHP